MNLVLHHFKGANISMVMTTMMMPRVLIRRGGVRGLSSIH
jgi:hypothetical protein